MTLISENWADALDPVVRKWFDQGYRTAPTRRTEFFNVQTSSRAYEAVTGFGTIGVDAWDVYEQSGQPAMAKFDQAYKTTYTHREYPIEVQIERKLWDDAQTTELRNIPMRLGRSAGLKQEYDAVSVFNNAFSGSHLGADSVALCSASHPLSPDKTGSTQANYAAYALNKDNVELVRQAMLAFTDDTGNRAGVMPNWIVVPPTLENAAIQVAQSLNLPGTANNDVNPQLGRWQVVMWQYLTDSNAWFVVDSSLMKMHLDWFNRQPLSINPKIEDKTLRATWIAYMRYSYGWSDFKWIFGCNPS